jgi:hypothetical protein
MSETDVGKQGRDFLSSHSILSHMKEFCVSNENTKIFSVSSQQALKYIILSSSSFI